MYIFFCYEIRKITYPTEHWNLAHSDIFRQFFFFFFVFYIFWFSFNSLHWDFNSFHLHIFHINKKKKRKLPSNSWYYLIFVIIIYLSKYYINLQFFFFFFCSLLVCFISRHKEQHITISVIIVNSNKLSSIASESLVHSVCSS